MTAKKKFCVVLVVASFAVLFFVITRRPVRPEPVYAGRTFSSWFHEDELAPNYVNDSESTKAIRAMGTNAIPFLIDRACHKDLWSSSAYISIYPKLPSSITRRLPPPRLPGVRELVAAELLDQFGSDARVAAPDLIAAYGRVSRKYLQLPPGRIDWARQLTNPAPPLVSAAPPSLPGGNFQMWALVLLARNGSDDPQVIPLLLSALHEPDSNLHGLILSGMKNNTNLTYAIKHSEPALFAALADHNPVVRVPVVEMLGIIAPGHPEVTPVLIKAANDPDNFVREAALGALRNSDVALPVALPMIARAFDETDIHSRMHDFALLIHASGGGGKMVPALEDALGDANPSVRIAAAQVLGYLGPRAKLAAPDLAEHTLAAQEPDEQMREAAASALKKISGAEISSASAKR